MVLETTDAVKISLSWTQDDIFKANRNTRKYDTLIWKKREKAKIKVLENP